MSSKSQSKSKRGGKRLFVAMDVDPTGTEAVVPPGLATEPLAEESPTALEAPAADATAPQEEPGPPAEAVGPVGVPGVAAPLGEEPPAAEPPVGASAEVVEAAPASAAPLAARRSSSRAVGKGRRAPAVADGDVREIDGELYVRVGSTWRASTDRVQMTIAVTAMERHRLMRYAEENEMKLIDVLRRAMGALLD